MKDHHADLLVLGTRAKTEAGRVALGTVARQLLAKSRCPILTISPDAAKSLPWAACWGRVLAATDFSPASVRALQCAHQLALRQLILLHVPEGERRPASAHCLEQLRFLAPFNESHTVPVEHIVDAGNAADLIDRYVREICSRFTGARFSRKGVGGTGLSVQHSPASNFQGPLSGPVPAGSERTAVHRRNLRSVSGLCRCDWLWR